MDQCQCAKAEASLSITKEKDSCIHIQNRPNFPSNMIFLNLMPHSLLGSSSIPLAVCPGTMTSHPPTHPEQPRNHQGTHEYLAPHPHINTNHQRARCQSCNFITRPAHLFLPRAPSKVPGSRRRTYHTSNILVQIRLFLPLARTALARQTHIDITSIYIGIGIGIGIVSWRSCGLSLGLGFSLAIVVVIRSFSC